MSHLEIRTHGCEFFSSGIVSVTFGIECCTHRFVFRRIGFKFATPDFDIVAFGFKFGPFGVDFRGHGLIMRGFGSITCEISFVSRKISVDIRELVLQCLILIQEIGCR